MCLLRIPLTERPRHPHCASLYGGIFKVCEQPQHWACLWCWHFYLDNGFVFLLLYSVGLFSLHEFSFQNIELLSRCSKQISSAKRACFKQTLPFRQHNGAKPINYWVFFDSGGRILTKPTYGKPTGTSISFLFRVYDPREQHRHERSLSFSLLLLIFRQRFKNRLECDSILQRGLLSYQSSWKSSRCLTVRIVLSLLNSENNSSIPTMVTLYFWLTLAQKCVGLLCSVKWVLLIAVLKPTGRLSNICIMRINCPNSAEEFNWWSQMI